MENDDLDISRINPGLKLKELLKEVFPKKTGGFVTDIDWALRHDGELVDIAYESTLDYLVRRFIKTAYFFKMSAKQNGEDFRDTYITTLRNHIKNETRVDEDYVERVLVLLQLCTDRYNSPPSKKRIHKLLNRTINDNIPCYICGSQYVDLTNNDASEQSENLENAKKLKVPEVEHIWPRSLGGSNEEFNLEVSCRKCNQNKGDTISSADFHFEHITYDTIANESNIDRKLKYEHKLAIWAKGGFQCSICERSPTEVGPLRFQRKNENEPWHYLNVVIFCSDHLKIENLAYGK